VGAIFDRYLQSSGDGGGGGRFFLYQRLLLQEMAETSIFEVARQTHEEVEQCIQAATDLLTSTPWTLKKEHQTSKMLDEIVSRNFTLHNFYRDVGGDAKDELMRLNKDAGTDNLAEFYIQLAKVKDYHKKYPNARPDVFSINLDEGIDATDGSNEIEGVLANDSVARLFSGEEMSGRFLDLYSHHEAFLNLKGIRRVSYLQYIDLFDKLQGEESKITNEAKRTDAYKEYLRGLQSYLLAFLRRTRPLTDVDAIEILALAAFEEQWEQGKVAGWEGKGEELASSSKAKETVQEGASEGVWCDACKRSFAKQTVFDAHLKGQKHLKAAHRLQGSNGTAQQIESSHAEGSNQSSELERMKRQARAKAIARDETIIISLGQELLLLRAETRANVERRSALTDKERQAEAEAATMDLISGTERERKRVDGGDEKGGDGEDEEDDEKIYNPLKLPLGWDGKPIPFWLYKLHGLGVDYRCEICSGFVYQGRKNFERHFTESRHAFGMRALGLPNSRHFNEITEIKDALALAEKLKKQGKKMAEEQEAEEVEDEHGNTYTKKTYELLRRQGLI
jgi:splicing factor 3A subunit 3